MQTKSDGKAHAQCLEIEFYHSWEHTVGCLPATHMGPSSYHLRRCDREQQQSVWPGAQHTGQTVWAWPSWCVMGQVPKWSVRPHHCLGTGDTNRAHLVRLWGWLRELKMPGAERRMLWETVHHDGHQSERPDSKWIVLPRPGAQLLSYKLPKLTRVILNYVMLGSIYAIPTDI